MTPCWCFRHCSGKIKLKFMADREAPLSEVLHYLRISRNTSLEHGNVKFHSGWSWLPLLTFPHCLAVPTQSDLPHVQLSCHLVLPLRPEPPQKLCQIPNLGPAHTQPFPFSFFKSQSCFRITVLGTKKINLCGARFHPPGQSRSNILT